MTKHDINKLPKWCKNIIEEQNKKIDWLTKSHLEGMVKTSAEIIQDGKKPIILYTGSKIYLDLPPNAKIIIKEVV